MLHDAVVEQLAEFTGDEWRDVYSVILGAVSGAASLPARVLEHLGNWTAARIHQLRRKGTNVPASPELPDPPEGWFGANDLRTLMHYWKISREPGYEPRGIIFEQDERGFFAGHLSLRNDTMAMVRLAKPGHPLHLVDLILSQPGGKFRSCLTRDVPLEITIAGERHLFRHVRGEPIFGEIVLGDRSYLLAVVSVFLVLVEVRGEDAAIVWAGRAEKLPTLALQSPAPQSSPGAEASQTPEAPLASSEPRKPVQGDDQARRDTDDERQRGRPDEQTNLTIVHTLEVKARELEDERRRRGVAENALATAVQALETKSRELNHERVQRAAAEQALAITVQTLETRSRELSDELHRRHQVEEALATAEQAFEIRDRELVEERLQRAEVEQERTMATAALELGRHAVLALQAELKAQAEAREQALAEASATATYLDLMMRALEAHAAGGDMTAWRQSAQAAIVADAQSGAVPVDPNDVEPFLVQLCELLELADRRKYLDRQLGQLTEASAHSSGLPASTPTAQAEMADETPTAPTTAQPPGPPQADQPPRRRAGRPASWSTLSVEADDAREPPRSAPKIGRNDPCSCGSGKKFKKCCWRSST